MKELCRELTHVFQVVEPIVLQSYVARNETHVPDSKISNLSASQARRILGKL